MLILKFFQKTEKEGTVTSTFYEASLMMIPRPVKDSTRKGSCRPISLMNINVRIIDKIQANEVQQEHYKHYKDHIP